MLLSNDNDDPVTFQLMEKLQEQSDLNKKLQEYVDNIILRIMEKNPSLLEVDSPKSEKKNKKGILGSLLNKSSSSWRH